MNLHKVSRVKRVFLAALTLGLLLPRFVFALPQAEDTVSADKAARSLLIAIKTDAAVPNSDGKLPLLPPLKPLSATATDVDRQAATLMTLGAHALAASDNTAAIDAFNKLLLLPPNDFTQDALEWVGVARERAGLQDIAKLEYELYLKIYTTGPGVAQVRKRLDRLASKVAPLPIAANLAGGKKRPKQTLSYGSLSMRYFYGTSKIDSNVVLANRLSQSTFSLVDQSALLTSLFATERFISDEYDNRIVFQDTAYTSFLPRQRSRNRLSSAYFEVKNKLSDYSARLGRQSSSGSGVLGRFDGTTVGYGITPTIRVNAVAGQLADLSVGAKPIFYGASVETGPITLYAIRQTIEGILDRSAVGTELRYFQPSKTAFILLDYDTSYAKLNVATFQGSLSPSPERNFNLLVDHRRAPYISTRNALHGALTPSLSDLLRSITEDEVRALAVARTGFTDLASLGVTQQLTRNWQIGGDIRVSRSEGLLASGTIDPIDGITPTLTGVLPATPGTGNEWALSPQLIANNLFSSNDVTVFNLSYLFSQHYRGQSFYLYNRMMFTDKWSLDSTLQLYRQQFESGLLFTRLVPTFRTAYQIRKTLNFDLDVGYEVNHSRIAEQSSDGRRKFFSLGFRWDF